MPENENNPSPKKKKRGFLWTIIIILIIILAATIGGYALYYNNVLPNWVTDMLPNSYISSAEPEDMPAVTQQPTEEGPEPSPSLSPAPSGEDETAASANSKDETAAVSGDADEVKREGAVTAPAVSSVPYIGADAAAEAALEHSKAAEKDADFSSVMLTEQNGMMLYEVIFTAGDYRYEYYIDSLSGRVESWKKTDISLPDQDALAASAMDEPQTSAAPDTDLPASSQTTQTTGATVLLGEDEAKKLAMAHANITEKDISSISCKIELQGLNLIYEVEMKTKLMEYDYEVDAVTGEIIGFAVEAIKEAK